jgi:hypothetical protein
VHRFDVGWLAAQRALGDGLAAVVRIDQRMRIQRPRQANEFRIVEHAFDAI